MRRWWCKRNPVELALDDWVLGSDERMQQADLIIYRGKIVKNRHGYVGTIVPIPDGLYTMTKLD